VKNTIFKTEEVYNNFSIILLNNKFWLKKYWFKRVEFEKILNTSWKIQYKTSLKLLKVYNDYYNLELNVNNLFKKKKILNKKQKLELNFTFIDDWKDSLYKVIDNVLSLIVGVFNIFKNKEIVNFYTNESNCGMEEDKLKRIIFIFTVIIYIYLFHIY